MDIGKSFRPMDDPTAMMQSPLAVRFLSLVISKVVGCVESIAECPRASNWSSIGLNIGHRISLISSVARGWLGATRKLADFRAERDKMVRNLIEEGLLKTQSVIEAMRRVPRELFVSESMGEYAHVDTPLPTEHGQTISAPRSYPRLGDTWWP